MSWEVAGWSMKAVRTAGPAMPAMLRWLLVCIADRTNRDTGYTYVSPRRLAEDHGSSVGFVKDGLRRLEALGFIARVKRLKADGSHDTSLLIVLDSDEAHARAAALGWTKPAPSDGASEAEEGGAGGEDEAQDVEGWVTTDPTPAGEGVGHHGPQGGSPQTPPSIDEPGIEPESPQPPSRARRPAEPSTDRPPGIVPAVLPAGPLPDGYDPDPAGANAFLATWRSTIRASSADVPEVIRRTWKGLSAEERRRAAGDLDAWHRQMAREKRPLGSATRYLRDKAWEVLDHVRAGRREGTAPPTFFIREGSPEWDAWARHEARHGRRLMAIPSQHEKGRGWWMPTLWPPREAGAGHGSVSSAAERRDEGLDDFVKASGL
jgi:hypothetical protein